jgi:uncharacterized protein YneF (UPF0154 family)
MGRKLSDATVEEIYQDAYEKIEECLETLDLKPYSANIISLRLASVGRKLGNEKANQLIDEFGLEAHGWHKEKVDGRKKKIIGG